VYSGIDIRHYKMIVSGDCLFVGGSGVRVFGMDEMFFSYLLWLAHKPHTLTEIFAKKMANIRPKQKYFLTFLCTF